MREMMDENQRVRKCRLYFIQNSRIHYSTKWGRQCLNRPRAAVLSAADCFKMNEQCKSSKEEEEEEELRTIF
jgi:hypothetical protein